MRSAAWALLPVGLAGALYARMLGAGYVWDDGIYQLAQLPYFRGVRDAFFPNIAAMQGFADFYYRPMIPLSSLLERAVAARVAGGTTPAWPHGVNVLIHMGVTALVFFLVRALVPPGPRRTPAATAGATLFAVHPIHAEAVCSVSGRTDLLAALFVMGAALTALAGRGRRTWPLFAVISALLFLCGLLSKETAVVALVLVPAALWCFPPGEEPQTLRGRVAYTSLLITLLLAAGVGYAVLRQASGTSLGGGSPLGVGSSLLRAVAALGWYVRKVVVPWPQLHFVARMPGLPLSAAVLAASGAVLAWLLRSARAGRAALGFPPLWFLATIAPALAVALRPLAANPVAERYLYLPSAALCLAAGQWVAAADFQRAGQRTAAAAGAAILIACAVSVVGRTGVWQDSLHFWTDAMRDPAAAESPVARTNLGHALTSVGRLAEARTHFERAHDLFGSPADRRKVLVNLAAIDLAEAETSLSRGAAAEARAMAEGAVAKLAAPLASELGRDAQPNTIMGAALLAQAQAGALLTGAADPALLRRALRHLDLARAVLPQDARIQGYRSRAQQLLAAGGPR